MKKTFKKKLALRKETIASLNDSQQMLVFGGGLDASDATFCQTNCPVCDGGGGGGGGSNGPVTSTWWTINPPPHTVVC